MTFKPKPLPDCAFNASGSTLAFSGNITGFASARNTIPKPVLQFTPITDAFGAPKRFQAATK